MLSRQSLRSILTVFGIIATTVLLGAGCNGCNHEEVVPPKKEVPTYTSKPIVGKVMWPSAEKIDQAAVKALKPEEAANIAQAGVPVLVPSDPQMLANGVIFAGTTSYFFAIKSPESFGLSISISGTSAGEQTDAPFPASAYEPDPNAIGINGFQVSIGQNDAGNWEADWGGNGDVAYNVHIVCLNPDDTRCLTNKYIVDVVRSLVYVGGNGK